MKLKKENFTLSLQPGDRSKGISQDGAGNLWQDLGTKQGITDSWVQSLKYYQVQGLKVIVVWGLVLGYFWLGFLFGVLFLHDSAIKKYHRNVYTMQPMQAYSSQFFKY